MMQNTVMRLSPRAHFLASRIATSNNQKLSEFIHELVLDYAKGLSFEDDPDLDLLPAPNPNVRVPK